jgi:XapX domain-containing protein
MDWFKALINFSAGAGIGAIFALIRLDSPAPPSVEAALGVVGLTVGYLAIKHFL